MSLLIKIKKNFNEDGLEHSSEDEAEEWLHQDFYITGDIQDEVKAQYKRAMKEPITEDPIHNKLALFYMDNLKLHKIQLTTLHSGMRSMQTLVEQTKRKKEKLLDDRLPALTMIQMQNKLKEESQLSNRITKVEKRMFAMERTLHALTEGNIHTNKFLQQLLNQPPSNQTLDANKK